MELEYDRLETDPKQKKNPKKTANIFSILSFWWVGQLLDLGSKRSLENDDLFPLLEEDKTQTSTEKLYRTWNEEKGGASSEGASSGRRLFIAIIRAFSFVDYLFILSVGLVTGVCNVLQPVFLSMLLPALMRYSTREAYVYAAGICLSSFVRAIATHQYRYHGDLMALRWKSATVGIVYRKVSKLIYLAKIQIRQGLESATSLTDRVGNSFLRQCLSGNTPGCRQCRCKDSSSYVHRQHFRLRSLF